MAIIPFGKYRGEEIEDIPSSYLRFLLNEEWFEERFEDLYDEVSDVYDYRDRHDLHWEEEKIEKS